MIASCRLWSVIIPRPGVRFMFQHGRTSYFFLSLPRSFVLHSPFPPVPFNAASAPASVNSIIVYTYIVNNFCPAVFVPSLPVRFYFYGICFSSAFCLPSIGIRPAGSVRSGFFFLLFIHGRGTYSLRFFQKRVSEHSRFFPVFRLRPAAVLPSGRWQISFRVRVSRSWQHNKNTTSVSRRGTFINHGSASADIPLNSFYPRSAARPGRSSVPHSSIWPRVLRLHLHGNNYSTPRAHCI